MDKDNLPMIYRADRLDQIHSARPDSERVDKRIELLLQSLVLDPEESRIDSTEEYEDTSSERDRDPYGRQGFTEDKDQRHSHGQGQHCETNEDLAHAREKAHALEICSVTPTTSLVVSRFLRVPVSHNLLNVLDDSFQRSPGSIIAGNS